MARTLVLVFVLALSVACTYAREGNACFHKRLKKSGFCRQLGDCPSAAAEQKQQCPYRRGDAATVCCPSPDVAAPSTTDRKKGEMDTALPCFRVLEDVGEDDDAVLARARQRGPPPPGTIAKAMCKQYTRHVCARRKASYAFDDVMVEDFCESANKTDQLIVGGREARSKEFPHMALLGYGQRDEIQYLCGGTLISPRHVLTAAHCVFSGDRPVQWVLLGSRARTQDAHVGARPQLIGVAARLKHPGYKPPNKYDDIALLRLASDAVFEEGFVRPACLGTDPRAEDKHRTATATGWGLTEWDGDQSSLLMTVTMDMTSHAACKKVYGTNSRGIPRGILDSQICAGSPGKDSCEGDSGGPLQQFPTQPYCMFHVEGVVSFGQFCGFNSPGVYSRVSHYLKWIEDVVWPGRTEERRPAAVPEVTYGH